MSEEAWRLADRLRMVVVSAGESPNGPWLVRHGRLIDPLRGSDIDALIVRAAQEISRA